MQKLQNFGVAFCKIGYNIKAMRVSFTGAQSTGKTTLLNKCKEIYKDYKFVDEVTRYVRRTYDVKINEIGGTETQLYILAEHIKNHLRTEENLMLDRCILDGYVYTKYQYIFKVKVYAFLESVLSVLVRKPKISSIVNS